jgi:hypothetical protein
MVYSDLKFQIITELLWTYLNNQAKWARQTQVGLWFLILAKYHVTLILCTYLLSDVSIWLAWLLLQKKERKKIGKKHTCSKIMVW